MKNIKSIFYNWYPTPQRMYQSGALMNPEGVSESYAVSMLGVNKIEFMDKSYCLIHFDDGHMEIQFNLNCIVFEEEKNESS